MTTSKQRDPNRTRDLVVGVLFMLLGGYSIWTGQDLRAEQERLDDCQSAFIASNSTTGVIRSRLVERESHAVRTIIREVFTTVKTPEQAQQAYRNYAARLRRIDAARAANPPQVFNDARCQKGQKQEKQP